MPHVDVKDLERPEGLTDQQWARVRILVEHAERWIAWDKQTDEFVEAADTPEALHELIERLGMNDRVILEWAPPFARSY